MMKISFRWTALVGLLALPLAGCLGGTSNVTSGPPFYVLAVASVNPINTAIPSISPADNNSVAAGVTGLQLAYNPGTSVTVTASASSTSGPFYSWTGCDSTTGLTCTVKMTSSRTVSVQYAGVTLVSLSPLTPSATVPSTTQFTATVNGLGQCTFNGAQTPCQNSPYTFSLSGPSGYSGSLGTISATGLYTTPYPAPPTVTVTVASQIKPSVQAFTTVTLVPPSAATAPTLTVDSGSPTHAISPLIYGMNDYSLDGSIPALINLPVERWGGDSTTRYNYLNDATNSAYDYYFENNFPSTTGYPVASQFDTQVTNDRKTKTKTIVTVPLIGYTTQRISACSYSVKKYGQQTVVDPNNTDCGTGLLGPLGGQSTGNVANNPTDTSVAIDQTFAGGWASFLDTQFGTAANGGVAFYSLDNEPEYWSGVHKDVHPNPMTYDELSQKGIAYATAVKTSDPGALVTGPVISNWTDYFYSALDIADGYAAGCPQANPVDRLAHGNVPLIEYYLQQFQAYQAAHGTRLLDYVDLHTYFAAPGAAFALAGDTTLQQARLNSTRVFWDPTYTDPNYTDPTTTKCSNPVAYPPNLINLMKGWVAKDYPGTKLAITEYNWGGQESINGALAQADILGIFGREGLDIGTLWGPPNPSTQLPGLMAFKIYTNYDGNGAHFGDTAVTSTSGNQGVLSVYGAVRTADNMLTVIVINKSYIDLPDTLSLPNLKPNGTAKSYLYSVANTAAFVSQPAITVTAPTGASTTSSLTTTFPAQSITLLVIPKQ